MGNFPYLVLILFKLGHFIRHLIDIWTLVYLGISLGLCHFFYFKILWKNTLVISYHNPNLRLVTKAKACKGEAKREAQESPLMFPGVQESVREWTLTLPSGLPLWELESQWTPKSLENDFRSQNPLDWGFPYIIGKFLELKCLKWACMTHLDT
jgi:hypothetical protein